MNTAIKAVLEKEFKLHGRACYSHMGKFHHANLSGKLQASKIKGMENSVTRQEIVWAFIRSKEDEIMSKAYGERSAKVYDSLAKEAIRIAKERKRELDAINELASLVAENITPNEAYMMAFK